MNLHRINKILLWGASTLLVAALVLWAFLHFMMHTSTTQEGGSTNSILNTLFGSPANQTTGSSGSVGTNQPIGSAVNGLQQKIFEISAGPVAGALFVQSGMPTTTVARYVMADSGHVFDLAVDVPGAVAKSVSNTTIPGLANVLWAQNVSTGQKPGGRGSAILLQYLENTTIKTVFVGFPTPTVATSTPTTTVPIASPVQIRFLPDNIASLSVSPDGTSIAYLLLTASGSTGYIASANGSGSRALFTLPLSQVTLAWPSSNALLAATKPDANSQGIVFSISTKTGAVNQLLYAQGITALADNSFSTVVYQSTANGTRLTYAHNIATGRDLGLSFQPVPEKCAWSPTATSTLFCAAPSAYTPTNYLDLWHQGLLNSPDALFVFNTQSDAALALASPGSTDGGSAASIASIDISPDGKYLLYITRGDRALWGVRLSN